MTMTLLLAAVVVLAVALAVAIVALVRGGGRHDDAAILGDQIEDAAHAQARAVERLERELRGEIVENARGSRTELAGSFAQLQQTLAAQLTSVATVQNNQIEGFAQQLGKLVAGNAQQFDAMRERAAQRSRRARSRRARSGCSATR